MGTIHKVKQYESRWEKMGYPEGIPDEVPMEINNLAPSWKAVAIALLSNDMQLTSLGFNPGPVSPWYAELKRIEIADRDSGVFQMRLF